MAKVNGICINGKQSYAVFTQDGYGIESAEEADKNIKLFNAAPELLKALKLIRNEMALPAHLEELINVTIRKIGE